MSDGLIGAMKGAKIPKLEPAKVILAMVFSAGVLLVAKKAGVPLNGIESVAIALLLGLAALGAEYVLSKEMTRLYIQRLPGPLALCFLVWAGAFAYGLNQWIGAASENQVEKGAVQKAAHFTYEDATKTVKRLEKAHAAAQLALEQHNLGVGLGSNLLINGKPVTTPEDAQKLIDGLKQDRRWTTTDQCTNATAKASREFCKSLSEAEAAKATAGTVVTLKAETPVLQKRVDDALTELNAARATAKTTKTVTSDERADLRIIKAYLGWDEQAAADVQAIGQIIVLSLFLTGLGILIEAKEHRGLPRKPWPLTVWLRGLLYGRKDQLEHSLSDLGNRNTEASAYSTPIKEQDVAVPPIPRPRVQALQLTTAAQLHRMAAA